MTRDAFIRKLAGVIEPYEKKGEVVVVQLTFKDGIKRVWDGEKFSSPQKEKPCSATE